MVIWQPIAEIVLSQFGRQMWIFFIPASLTKVHVFKQLRQWPTPENGITAALALILQFQVVISCCWHFYRNRRGRKYRICRDTICRIFHISTSGFVVILLFPVVGRRQNHWLCTRHGRFSRFAVEKQHVSFFLLKRLGAFLPPSTTNVRKKLRSVLWGLSLCLGVDYWINACSGITSTIHLNSMLYPTIVIFDLYIWQHAFSACNSFAT